MIDSLTWGPWVSGLWKVIKNTDGVPELRAPWDLRKSLFPMVTQLGNALRSQEWLVILPRCRATSNSRAGDLVEGMVVRRVEDGEVFWTSRVRDWTRTRVLQQTPW